MNIAERITYLRTEKNYSVNKLANLCGISQSYLRDIELGKKNPTVEMLSLICNTLNISLHDFFAEDEADSITNDPLVKRIYRLSPKQKTELLNFLDAMNDNS
jgi:transcriptional regulator with XRE-family HTH domain